MSRPAYLTKSRFVAGLQCPKMLWWQVHEPDAPELVVDAGTQAVFDRGHRVGAAARERFPGGVLIDVPYHRFTARVEATRAALASKAPAVFEASFMEDGVFVAVDVLERRRGRYALIEVKSTLDVKDAHIPDVSIQWHVLRQAGLPVRRVEVMHLDRACRYPDLSNLFVRADVTARAKAEAAHAPARIRALRAALEGPLPAVATGPHCKDPYECAFLERCWPRLPEHHVSTLYRIGAAKAADLVGQGYETIHDLPAEFDATGPARRQIDSVKRGVPVVERGLKRTLASFADPIAFLDFETVAPAIPVWAGCGPYEPVPVQWSCHVARGDRLDHRAWLADGPEDPREAIAEALLVACEGSRTVLAWNAAFEKRCIAGLAVAVPRLAAKLCALSDRVQDLLPVVRDHVYHPAFGGSFRLKAVLPALVEGMGYDDLEVRDGEAASAALEALLLTPGAVSADERLALRRRLLAYCERDTLGMVRLYERLREMA